VTDAVRSGDNAIEVIVIGTLKNTLGPHHAGAHVVAPGPACSSKAPNTARRRQRLPHAGLRPVSSRSRC